MMTREERSTAIRAGQKVAWANGIRWGNHIKGDLTQRERLAAAVDLGEMSLKAAANEIGIHPVTLRSWMQSHGFKTASRRSSITPSERDMQALREYWRRECGVTDVMYFTKRSWSTVHRWIIKGYGKE